MTQNEFDEVVLTIIDECKELLRMKGDDYTNRDVDRLAHFKQAEQETSSNRWQTWETLFWKHMRAIRTWVKTRSLSTPTEQIHHRIVDAINYLILLDALVIEDQHANRPVEEAKLSEEEDSPIQSGRTDRT